VKRVSSERSQQWCALQYVHPAVSVLPQVASMSLAAAVTIAVGFLASHQYSTLLGNLNDIDSWICRKAELRRNSMVR
jgi:hypothetical protein